MHVSLSVSLPPLCWSDAVHVVHVIRLVLWHLHTWGNQPEGWLSVVCSETGAVHWQTPHFRWAAGMEGLRMAQDPTVLVLGRTIDNSAS